MSDTFGIDDQMVGFALLPVVDNIVNQLLLVVVVLFRKQDILRAGADAAPQCDITGISAHYLDDTAASHVKMRYPLPYRLPASRY